MYVNIIWNNNKFLKATHFCTDHFFFVIFFIFYTAIENYFTKSTSSFYSPQSLLVCLVTFASSLSTSNTILYSPNVLLPFSYSTQLQNYKKILFSPQSILLCLVTFASSLSTSNTPAPGVITTETLPVRSKLRSR